MSTKLLVASRDMRFLFIDKAKATKPNTYSNNNLCPLRRGAGYCYISIFGSRHDRQVLASVPAMPIIAVFSSLKPLQLFYNLVGIFSTSFSHTTASASLGARQSPRGESEPPEPTLGPSGSAERLNWLILKKR